MPYRSHYKLYKSGKLWCVTAISVLLLLPMMSQTSYADAQPNTHAQVTDKLSQASTNQVPVDNQTQGNQINVNQGHLDSCQVSMSQNGQAQLKVSGWQAIGNSNEQRNRYVLVYDNTSHSEIARTQSPVIQRPDVQRAYPNVDNSLNSGFDLSLNVPANTLRDSLSIISRYSDDSVNGEGHHTDYWFAPLDLDQANRASTDNLSSQDGKLTFSGWHASNLAADKKYHYIIAFDQTAGREIARQLVNDGQSRHNAFPTIADAAESGFKAQFNLTPAYANDNIQFVSRWTNDSAGNGSSTVDYWFSPVQKINRGHLDSWNVSDGHVAVSGWHANDASIYEPYHFLILFDQTTNRQVTSELVPTVVSTDVAKVYGNDTKTAGHSRFNFDFADVALIAGHQYSLVSRYSAINTGNGDDGHGDYTDYWFPAFSLDQSQKAYYIDSITTHDHEMDVNGWFANNASSGNPYAYAILLADGKEISRQQLTMTARPDVAKVYPHLLASGQSGFHVQLSLPKVASDNYQIVLRFTDDPAGNGSYQDIYSRLTYFDPQSHQLVRNRFLSLPSQDRSIYFGNNGLMTVDNVNIDGHIYHFDNQNGKFYSFSQRVIDWFRSREERLTYSQWGARNGSDGTADCSGAITQAIRDAGGYDYGHIYHDNYDTNHQDFYDYIVNNGYHQVYEGTSQYTPQYGDIVVWSPFVGDGHAMVISSFGNNPNVISVCGYTNEQPGTAVQEFNYNWYWNYAGRPNQVVYRPNNLSRA